MLRILAHFPELNLNIGEFRIYFLVFFSSISSAKFKNYLFWQIDDLIITPNHGLPGPEGGGSALKNLAMIASRYQGTKTTSGAGRDGDSPTEAKRARVESGE